MLKYIYSGGYTNYDGSLEMIEGFISSNTNSRLLLTGSLPNHIINKIKFKHNIKTFGFVSSSKLIELIDESDLCLCPRSVSFKHSKTTFPSKLFKYMQQKKRIACVNYPGIPRSLINKLIIIPDNSPKEWELFFRNYPSKVFHNLGPIDYNDLLETKTEKLLSFLLDK